MYVPPLFYIARLLPVPVTIDEFQPIKYTESKEAGRNETDNRDIKNVELPMEPENYDEAREMVLRKRKDVKVKYEFPSREHSITSNDGYDHGNENKNKAGRLKSFGVSKNDGKGHELQLSDKNKSAGDKNSYKGDRLDMLAKDKLNSKGGMAMMSKPPLKKKYLVLDLDETLIHSSPHGTYKAHLRIEVVIDKMACLYYVYKRPYVDYFLRKVSEWYNVVIFTASVPEYADPVISFLDPKGVLVSNRLFRDSCIPYTSTGYTKDLRVISNDLSQVILVDNSSASYFINQENAIPINAWFNDDPKDEGLLDLLPFLDALRFIGDVRSVLSLRSL